MRPLELRDPSPEARRAAERLERALAATRPADPSPLLLDALWARAAAGLDRLDAARAPGAPIPPAARRPAWLRFGMPLALAQAALILIAATILLNRPGAESPRMAQMARPTTARPMVAVPPLVEVAADSILVFRIDGGNDARVERLDQAPMFPVMAEHTQHDLFNYLESQESFPAIAENSAPDFFDEAASKATP